MKIYILYVAPAIFVAADCGVAWIYPDIVLWTRYEYNIKKIPAYIKATSTYTASSSWANAKYCARQNENIDWLHIGTSVSVCVCVYVAVDIFLYKQTVYTQHSVGVRRSDDLARSAHISRARVALCRKRWSLLLRAALLCSTSKYKRGFHIY